VAVVLGVVIVLLVVAAVPLSLTADSSAAGDIALFTALILSFGTVGVVVARRQPWNAVGWILCAVAILMALCTFEAQMYVRIAYRIHPGALPLGKVAIFLGQWWAAPLLLGFVVILLVPDGHLPSPRWRWVLTVYCVASGLGLAIAVAPALSVAAGERVEIDANGSLTSPGPHVPQPLRDVVGVIGLLVVAWIVGCWIAFVTRQVMAYRAAVGVRREQLKWIMCGAAVTAMSIPVFMSGLGTRSVLIGIAAIAGLTALPISIGVAILRYRLYDIDRILSRTLSYAILTVMLAGLYLAGVSVIGDLLERLTGQSGTVAVTLATLAVAVAFQPLRGRVQRAVDHRFNRRRYDAARTLDSFATRLREQIDLDALRGEVLTAVTDTVQPSHASVWLRGP
jgi:hypothetical protein